MSLEQHNVSPWSWCVLFRVWCACHQPRDIWIDKLTTHNTAYMHNYPPMWIQNCVYPCSFAELERTSPTPGAIAGWFEVQLSLFSFPPSSPWWHAHCWDQSSCSTASSLAKIKLRSCPDSWWSFFSKDTTSALCRCVGCCVSSVKCVVGRQSGHGVISQVWPSFPRTRQFSNPNGSPSLLPPSL